MNYFVKRKYLREYKRMQKNAQKTQEQLLFSILKENSQTTYGKKYGFSEIQTIKEFKKRVPEITFTDIEKDIEDIKKNGTKNVFTKDDILFFATTSGSMGTPKYIPVTKKRLEHFRSEFILFRRFILKNFPRVITGKTLYFAANQLNGITPSGIEHGNISGFVTYKSPWYVQKKLVIPEALNNEFDFDKKTKEAAKLSLYENVTQIGFATPNQGLVFINYLKKEGKKLVKEMKKEVGKKEWKKNQRLTTLEQLIKEKKFTPAHIWPNLQIVSCIKTETHRLYIEQLKASIGKNVIIRDPGIYSSEGRVSLGITQYDDAGILCLNENFYEFKERLSDNSYAKKTVTVNEMKKNTPYQVIWTTQEGLYRYNMGDEVEKIGTQGDIPIVRFVGRAKTLSIVEEHAPYSDIIASAQTALEELSLPIRSYTVAPNMENLLSPRYELFIELNKGTITEKKAKELSKIFDDTLQENILTYAETRNEFGRMKAPIVSIVKKGTYDTLDAKHLGRTGQSKPINVVADTEFRKQLSIEKTY